MRGSGRSPGRSSGASCSAAGFGIKVLAREAQVVLHRAELNLGPAKGQSDGLPDHCALSCNQPLRRAQVIVDVVVQARPDFVFPKRHRLLPQPGIFPEYGAVPGNLRQQPALQIIEIVPYRVPVLR